MCVCVHIHPPTHTCIYIIERLLPKYTYFQIYDHAAHHDTDT